MKPHIFKFEGIWWVTVREGRCSLLLTRAAMAASLFVRRLNA
jgi:hypothetical protein